MVFLSACQEQAKPELTIPNGTYFYIVDNVPAKPIGQETVKIVFQGERFDPDVVHVPLGSDVLFEITAVDDARSLRCEQKLNQFHDEERSLVWTTMPCTRGNWPLFILEGYGKEAPLIEGSSGFLRFTADKEGLFPFRLSSGSRASGILIVE